MIFLAISKPNWNMCPVGLTSRSSGQILENSCLHSRGNNSQLIFIKLSQNVCLTISRPSTNMGHVGKKTMSPGQILGNSC